MIDRDKTPFANNVYGLIGQSQAVNHLIDTINRVKDVDSTILVLGESGTGKELVARAIHKSSQRSSKTFAAINCSAIPEHLLESELFGHKRGAFTDAKTDRKGIFELCHGGTLLLDEIGDMPINLQSKLLRILQEKQVTPIGSSKSMDVDTRVVAATHRNIFEEIKQQQFREDLFFRLSVVVIHIPPLRDRLEDIPDLVLFFLSQLNTKFQRNIDYPTDAQIRELMNYSWPGNVRELQNVMERGVVLAKDQKLDIRDMFQNIGTQPEANYESDQLLEKALNLPLTAAKQLFEKQYVEQMLKKSRGNISEVARKSGRYRADIYRLMERYGFRQENYRS